jgi:hypothetical protein
MQARTFRYDRHHGAPASPCQDDALRSSTPSTPHLATRASGYCVPSARAVPATSAAQSRPRIPDCLTATLLARPAAAQQTSPTVPINLIWTVAGLLEPMARAAPNGGYRVPTGEQHKSLCVTKVRRPFAPDRRFRAPRGQPTGSGQPRQINRFCVRRLPGARLRVTGSPVPRVEKRAACGTVTLYVGDHVQGRICRAPSVAI